MRAADLLRSLPWDKAAKWDPVGLQLGDPDAHVERVAVCHEVTERVVAESAGADLLISYHPLLFKPVTRLLAGPGPAGRAYSLLTNRVGLAVVHTAWDTASGGTADALATACGLEDIAGFGLIEPPARQKLVTFVPPSAYEKVVASLLAAGAGTIGNYRGCAFRSEGIGSFVPEEGAAPAIGVLGVKEEVAETRLEILLPPQGAGAVVAALLATHPYEEPAFDLIETTSNPGLIGRVGSWPGDFADLLARVARLAPTLRVAAPSAPSARRVAVLPGSGGSFVGDAVQAGADVFITGDLSHHQQIEALDRGLTTVDVGHAHSEQPGVKALLAIVGRMVPDVLDLTYDPTPWQPYP